MSPRDRKNESQPPNELVKLGQNLPEVHLPEYQVARNLRHMEYIAFVSRTAMALASDTHVYAVLKLFTTVQQAELLQQACGPLSPRVEEAYQRQTQEYIDMMEAIPREVATNVMEVLSRIPNEITNDDFLDKLRQWLGL